MHKIDNTRIRQLNSNGFKTGPVIYWMMRDQRAQDNWALLHAQNIAEQNSLQLYVCFTLLSKFQQSNLRNFAFMLNGLVETEKELEKLNISLIVIKASNGRKKAILDFVKNNDAGTIVTDFSALKGGIKLRKDVANQFDGQFFEVDTHNVVPIWVTSQKEEYAARTIRPKIHANLKKYLTDFPKLNKQKEKPKNTQNNDWDKLYKFVGLDYNKIDFNSLETQEMYKNKDLEFNLKFPVIPGDKAANKQLNKFINSTLKDYNESRNDPNEKVLSNMSPYMHYGQIAPQRVAYEVQNSNAKDSDKEAYIEELVVRRELADNFCYYNKEYDSTKGFKDWAKKTLKQHEDDPREYIYTKEQFEHALTHDNLWNAAQMQLIKTGKMHGYMRMYWAKKIMEWTNTYEYAMEVAIYLNDKYELDGRDPNGYTGIAWSIGGIHDRAWFERDIFGKIRYMNYNGAKRKFDVEKYIKTWLQPSLFAVD